MHSSFGIVVACTVTGAAVKKKNCAGASRATSILYVNSNVRLILPRFGSFFNTKSFCANHSSMTAGSFGCPLHGLTRTN